MDFRPTEEQVLLRRTVREFAETEIRPYVREWDQEQKYLVPLARGEKIGAWGLTESTSGSDAAGMRTTATRAGACWVINGSKMFTTHGRVGDVMVVMAVTNRALGSKGVSAFIV